MRAAIVAFVMIGATSVALAQDTAAELDRQIAACRTFTACFRLLDENERVAGAHASEWAFRLEQFGDRAKRDLLKRALVRNNVVTRRAESADTILRYWQGWSDRDIPELRRIFSANYDSQIGWALVKIDSEESIRVLVEDAALHGSTQSAEPLAAASQKALPHIVRGLASEEWGNFSGLLWQIRDKVALPHEAWAVEAADATKPISARVTALRALSSLRSMSPRVRLVLEPLLLDSNRDIQLEAVRAVRAAKGEVPAEALANVCPQRGPFSSRNPPNYEYEWMDCLRDLADLGSSARPFGDVIVSRFLESPNGADRADGATVLGFIDSEPAEPKLIELLHDSDWRVVYASMRALGWLGARDAIPSVQQAGNSHWLPDIRSYAQEVVAALQSPTGRLERPSEWAKPSEQSRRRVASHFEITSTVLLAGVCSSGTWQWQDIRFRAPDRRTRRPDTQLAIRARNGFPDGRLTGTDNGEFGGYLLWKPRRGDEEFLYRGNIAAIESSSEGAIVVVHEGGGGWALDSAYDNLDEEVTLISNGPSGFGFALHATRDADGKWQMREVARLPQGEVMAKTIGKDLYAAWSAGRAIVFDTRQLLGLANCVDQ